MFKFYSKKHKVQFYTLKKIYIYIYVYLQFYVVFDQKNKKNMGQTRELQ